MTLREKQSTFAYQLARLLLWIYDHGWEVTLAEGYVGDTDAADGDHDGPHKQGGGHYRRLAQDLNLFVDGALVADGGHPIWTAIGQRWLASDSLARWGGTWGDANHFSFTHEGVA